MYKTYSSFQWKLLKFFDGDNIRYVDSKGLLKKNEEHKVWYEIDNTLYEVNKERDIIKNKLTGEVYKLEF